MLRRQMPVIRKSTVAISMLSSSPFNRRHSIADPRRRERRLSSPISSKFTRAKPLMEWARLSEGLLKIRIVLESLSVI